MSTERRHLRFLITSALLVGPALGCGSTDPEPNTVAPPQSQAMEDPTGTPLGPEPEVDPVAVEEEPPPSEPEVMPTANTPARPMSPEQVRPARQETAPVDTTPAPLPVERPPSANERPE